MRNRVSSHTQLSRAIALCTGVLLSTAAVAQDDLIASVDLPGVPISITDGKRKAVSDEPADTQAVQDQAAQKRQQQREEIQKMGEQANKLLAANDASDQENQGDQEDQGDQSSSVKDRVRDIQSDAVKSSAQSADSNRITVKPGVNRLVQISRGHPNRVVVPFENAQIRTTTSDAEISAKGPVIYAATNSDRPVTLFVSPEGNERVAISLTLIPKSIPPQEINVEVDTEFSQQFKFANPTAEKWEERGSYLDTLVAVFESLARQDIPRGYSMRNPLPSDPLTCWAEEDVVFEIGQVVEGHNIEVQILVAENQGERPVEIVGSMCSGERVMAAAEWPRSVLEPAQKTEVYVARQRLDEAQEERSRPSLINDGE